MATPRTVLLLPGLLCDEAVWAHARRALAPRAQVVVPDFGATNSVAAMARLAVAAAPARFALAGHSMGGRVALEIARIAPERVERIALLDTGIDPLADGLAGERERAGRMALLRLAEERGMRAMGRQWARGMVHPDHVDTALFESIVDMIERRTPAVFAAQIRALLGRPDARAVFTGLAMPTLLLCGREDAWSPLRRHEAMRDLLPGSRLVVVEQSGHMTPMEQPEAVSRALADWLG